MNQDIEALIHLIQESILDQTIKDILIRDLTNEGLTEFLKEQIRAYCLEGIKILDEKIIRAQQILNDDSSGDPNY